MSADAPVLDRRVFFGSLGVLLVEGNDLEGEILVQVLKGFRVRGIFRCAGTAEASEHARRNAPDLVIAGSARAAAGEVDEYEFVRQLRQQRSEDAARVPVILLAGHTSQANVIRARDCGASIVVAKPVTPQVLYDRLVWLAADARAFVATPGYAGPDRRFQTLGPPPDTEGRRRDDLSLKLGDTSAPNLSQSAIDAFLNAKGAVR